MIEVRLESKLKSSRVSQSQAPQQENVWGGGGGGGVLCSVGNGVKKARVRKRCFLVILDYI